MRPLALAFLLLCITGFCGSPVRAEEPQSLTFSYGLTMGGYFANPATANYYNGSGRNNLAQALGMQHTNQRIRESLGYNFELNSLPGDMAYTPAILIGIYGTLLRQSGLGIIGEFTYTRLKADDSFTLKLDKPSFIEGDNILRFPITGNEERSEMRLGLQYVFFQPGNQVHPFIEAGGSMTSTKVRSHSVSIEGNTFSVRNFTDAYHGIRDDGIGFGAFVTSGVRMDMVEGGYSFVLGGSAQYSNIRLDEQVSAHMQFALFLRLSLDPLTAGTAR